MAVIRASSGGVAIRYVLPVLWMMSCFYTIALQRVMCTRKRHALFHRRTRASYVYNGCLAWYNVVLTARIHSSVKFVGLPLATRATVE